MKTSGASVASKPEFELEPKSSIAKVNKIKGFRSTLALHLELKAKTCFGKPRLES